MVAEQIYKYSDDYINFDSKININDLKIENLGIDFIIQETTLSTIYSY